MAQGKRAAWDPEPQKLHRAAGPTWHRVGWTEREFHTTEARLKKEQQYQHEDQQQNQRLLKKQREQLCPVSMQRQAQRLKAHQKQKQAMSPPVMVHTHSSTYMHSFKQAYTHKTTLVKQWVPGEGDAPAPVMNMEGLCDELNTRLLNVDSTLVALLLGRRQSQQQNVACGSEAARQKLAQSLDKQLAFSTAMLLDWCGATSIGSSEQVLQKLLA